MIFDPSPYIAGHRAANEAERKAIRERVALALEEAKSLSEQILAKDPEVEAVILFGSLAEGMPSRLGFDIDLALIGGDVYRAEETTETSTFDVDVVKLDRLPEHIQARIRDTGVVMAERNRRGEQ